jgi:hypothetical protein
MHPWSVFFYRWVTRTGGNIDHRNVIFGKQTKAIIVLISAFGSWKKGRRGTNPTLWISGAKKQPLVLGVLV